MAIKKENASLTANSDKLRNKTCDGLIRVRGDLKAKEQQKTYEGGVDPQDDQLNTFPEGQGESRGGVKPGEGNRLHTDDGQHQRKKETKK